MCGILGIAAVRGRAVSPDRETIERMRDVMRHRGPDGAGVWGCGHVVLAHRRLAVIDPTPAGAQPMVTPDGRYAIAYNGELYNDAEVRAELEGAQPDLRGQWVQQDQQDQPVQQDQRDQLAQQDQRDQLVQQDQRDQLVQPDQRDQQVLHFHSHIRKS